MSNPSPSPGQAPFPSDRTRGSRRKHFDTQAWRDDWRRASHFLSTHFWAITIGAGVLLRLYGLLCGRWFWLDESMLMSNVADQPVFRIVGPLKQEQVVPPGFLMTLRAIHGLFGSAVIPLRFPAFLAGTVAFVAFALWARRRLPEAVARIAAWLMAFNADALYYCQEMKPYAFDLLATVVGLILLDSIDPNRAESVNDRHDPRSDRRPIVLSALFLLSIPWFSIASLFPVAASLAIALWHTRSRKSSLRRHLSLAAGWGLSFLAAWTVERSQVVRGSVLWNFWDFAFLKPLRQVDTLCVLADNLINPLHWLTAFEAPWLMFPWVLAVSFVLAHGLRRTFAFAPLPAVYALIATGLVAAASIARFYPFHGRTILFLLPLASILFASGLAHLPIRRQFARSATIALLLVTPTLSAVHIRPFSHNRLISFDGDLEHDHFTRRYGVVKRINTPPRPRTEPPPKSP